MSWLDIEAKYKRRDANDNKRGYKVRNAKCKVQNAKCKMRVAIATANINVMPFCIRLPPSLYLLSLFFQLPSLFLSSALSEMCLVISKSQLCSVISESRTTMSEWQLSLTLASFPSLADYLLIMPANIGLSVVLLISKAVAKDPDI